MQNNYLIVVVIGIITLQLAYWNALHAQVSINMDDVDGRTIQSCSGNFFDSGGPGGDYARREDYTVTFCADAANPGKSTRLTFRSLDLDSRDELTFYDGPNTTAPVLEVVDERSNDIVPFSVSATRTNISGCMTVRFTSARLLFFASEGAGWRAEIGCINRCQVIQAELVSSDPPVMPADTGWIDACIGQEISFQGRGIFPQEGLFYSHAESAEYFWSFGDGTRASGKNVTHTYTESGGYLVQLTIIDQVGCISVNTIDQRVRISPRPEFTVQTTPQFCVGDTIDLLGTINTSDGAGLVNANSVEEDFEPRYERADSLFLPDGKGVAYETSVNITQFSTGQTLENINDLLSICINIEHSYMRDLQVSIQCPNGREVIMQNFEDKGRREIYLGEPVDIEASVEQGLGYDYCWTPNATNGTWIDFPTDQLVGGRILPAGDYTSFVSLDSLVGCPLNGQWTMTIEDYLLRDNGYIFDWNIAFNPNLYPALERFKPTIVDFGWLPDNMPSTQATLATAGENPFTFFTTDEFGCTYDTTLLVQSLPLSHPDCYNCVPLIANAEDMTICDEETAAIDVSSDALAQNVQFDAFPNYTNLNNSQHSNENPYKSIINVNSISPAAILDVNSLVSVCVDISTPNNKSLADLTLWLESPNGRRVELISGTGEMGADFQNTCFTFNSSDLFASTAPPYSGSFQPSESFEAFTGAPSNGNWKLVVADNGSSVNATLEHWSIEFLSTNTTSFEWLPADGLSCDDCPNPTITPTEQLITQYILEANDQYGCTNTDTITVTNISNLEVPSINCSTTDNKELQVSWTAMDTLDYEISLDGTNWFDPSMASAHLIAGLERDEVVNIALRPQLDNIPLICTLPTNDTVCVYVGCELEMSLLDSMLEVSCFDSSDGSVELAWQDGTAPYQLFYDSQLINSGQDATFAQDKMSIGNHQFVVEDAESCFDTLQVVISSPPQLQLTAELQNPTCAEEENGVIAVVVEGGTPDFQYSLDGVLFNGRSSFSSLSSGFYTVIVKDANDCEAQQEVELISPQPIDVFIANDEAYLELEYGDSLQLFTTLLNAQGKVNYDWSSVADTTFCQTCDAPLVRPTTTTFYNVAVTDEMGCKTSNRIEIVVSRTFKYYVPNAFSPNKDGRNERLTVYSESGTVVKQFSVFDRWGNLLFENTDFAANDNSAGWDGTFKGELLNDATFTWVAKLEYADGVQKVFTGSTNLFR